MNKDKVYIKSSDRIRNRLRKCIDNVGGVSNFSKLSGAAKSTIRGWLSGNSAIPIKAVQLMVKILNYDLWNFLEKERLRGLLDSGRYLKISKTITPEEALIIGWILSEGHLETYRVSISQNNQLVLEKLKKIISQTYGLDSSFLSIGPDKQGFKLRVNTAAFSQYTNFRFGIPIGRKARTVKISNCLVNGNKETKIALLTGLLEGDGSVSFYSRRLKSGEIFKAPRVSFNTYSDIMSSQILFLLKNLSYHPKAYPNNSGENKVEIFELSECCRFFFDIYPYLIHPEVIRKFIKLLSQPRILNIIRIDGKEIIKRAHNRFKTSRSLANYISQMGYKISPGSVRNWMYGCFRPPLGVVINLCNFLRLSYFDFIPKWLAGLLWIHNMIPTQKLEKFRRLKINL